MIYTIRDDGFGIQHKALGQVGHSFFSRRGGVSQGEFATLNCSLKSNDNPEHLQENIRRIEVYMQISAGHLLLLDQTHGTKMIRVDQIWQIKDRPQADAMVTNRPEVSLGIITADCVPLLLSNPKGDVVGVAHAGWRGATEGVLESVLDGMSELGAEAKTLVTVIGPCIAARVYEVGIDMKEEALERDTEAGIFFQPTKDKEHFLFNLAGYCSYRLRKRGVQKIYDCQLDTLTDVDRFFSYRRKTLFKKNQMGSQLSVIACRSSSNRNEMM